MRVAYRLAAVLAAMITGLMFTAAAPASAAGPTRTLWTARYSAPADAAATGEAVSPDGSTLFVSGYTDFSPETGPKGGATIAYNAATGAVVWTKTTSDEVLGNVAVSPNGSMLFAAGYTDAGDAVTAAYNAATGAPLWTQQLSGGGGAPFLAVSPDGATLYLGTGDSVVAYAAATGHTLWTTPQPDTSSIPLAGALSPDGSVLVLTGTADTAAYDATTGAVLWDHQYGSPHTGIFHTSSVAVSPDGSTVYVGGCGGRKSFTGGAVRAYDSATGTTRWTRFVRQSPGCAILLQTSLGVSPDGSTLFFAGGGRHSNGNSFWVTQARDPATGKLLWSRSRGAPSVDTAPQSLAVNPLGSAVYVTGAISSGSSGGRGNTTVAYSTAGGQLWAAGAAADGGVTLVAPDGSAVFVTGATGFGFGTTAFRS